jgi:hypothetical protein
MDTWIISALYVLKELLSLWKEINLALPVPQESFHPTKEVRFVPIVMVIAISISQTQGGRLASLALLVEFQMERWRDVQIVSLDKKWVYRWINALIAHQELFSRL